MAVTEITEERNKLDSSFRCDSCGAQAYIQATFSNGFDLLFCVHHHKMHKDKLQEIAILIHDESNRLV